MQNDRMAILRSLAGCLPYGWALLSVAAAALLRAALDPLLGDHYPLGTFYAAVAIVGWYLGANPAIFTAILGYLIGSFLFMSPRDGTLASHFHGLELPAYVAICTALIVLVYRIFDRQRQLDQALEAHVLAKQAILDSDARFKQYLDAMPDIVYTWKADGSPEYVNPRWAEYTGAEAATDSDVAERVPAEDLEKLMGRREQALLKGTPLRAEFRLRNREGRWRWFQTRCVPIRDATTSVIGWVGSSINIDEEKRAGEALEISERRYRSVSEAFDFGTWSADENGRLTFASPRLLQFLGLRLEDAQQRLWSAILAPENDIELVRWQQCITTGQPWDWESSLAGADGTVRR